MGIIKFNLFEEIKNNWAHESENYICSCDDGTGTDIDIRKNNDRKCLFVNHYLLILVSQCYQCYSGQECTFSYFNFIPQTSTTTI